MLRRYRVCRRRVSTECGRGGHPRFSCRTRNPFVTPASHGESPMNVNNVGPSSPVQKLVQNPVQKQLPTEQSGPTRASDRLELSGASHLLKALKSNDVRADKVASIKAEIENGTYVDDHKLDVAIDKLLDDLTK